MQINFLTDDRGDRIAQIDGAKLIFRNFEGRGDKYNREGDRNFAFVIPNEELANKLMNDINDDGAGWNVKIKPPRDEDDSPFMYLSVKVKFNKYGPRVYLHSGGRKPVLLDSESAKMLDVIDIRSADLDIRAFDNITNGKPYRTAYLQSIHVTQDIDRFAARYAEEEYPCE